MVAMKSRRYDRAFVLGLCLYARSLQLSIDRTLPQEWIELRHYICSRVPIEDVLSHIVEVGRIKSSFDLTSPPSWPAKKRYEWRRRLAFDKSELNVVAWWLAKADALLAEDNPRPEEAGEVRLHLAYCEGLVRARLSRRDRKLTNVEHFNQNPILDCKPIEELIGEAWPPGQQ